MKKLTLTFALVAMAQVAAAQDMVRPPAAAQAKATESTVAVKTHEFDAEIVAFDAAMKTLTIKGSPDNKTVPVDAKAVAMVKNLKPGDKVTLICRDSDKGEHLAVAGVKVKS